MPPGKRKRVEAAADDAVSGGPAPEQAQKLISVLSMLDEAMLDQAVSSADWTCNSLRSALDAEPPATFDTLREMLVAARQAAITDLEAKPLEIPAASSSTLKTADEEAELDAVFAQRIVRDFDNQDRREQLRVWFAQAQALLDELEYGRSKGKRGFLPPMPEDGDLPRPLVSLHRTVGGSQDIYSSSIVLDTSSDLPALLGSLKDTDVFATDIRSQHASNRIAPARISDANLRPQPPDDRFPFSAPEQGPSKARLTQFLAYDPYASFAPTHDSYAAQLGYYESLDLLASSKRVATHQRRPFSTPEAKPAPSPMSDDELAEACKAAGFTPPQIQKLLEQSHADDPTTALLHANAVKIRQLQILQWDRLRRAVSNQKGTGELELISDTVSAEEREAASAVLKSLTEVVASVEAASPAIRAGSQVVLQEALQAPQFLPTDPAPVAHRGTLDPANVTTLREEYLTKLNYVPAAAARARAKPKRVSRGGGDKDGNWR